MALHSKDVIRFGLEGKAVAMDWETYRAGQLRGDERDRQEKRKRTIDLRFEYRSVVDSFAYEQAFTALPTNRKANPAGFFWKI